MVRSTLHLGCALWMLLLAIAACEPASSSCDDDLCGEGTTCDAATGMCVADTVASGDECQLDYDCADDTLRCSGGQCVSKCEGVQCDLAAGEVCNPTSGSCVGGNNCQGDSDCGNNGVCIEGSCFSGRNGPCQQRSCVPELNCVEIYGGRQCLAPCTSFNDCLLYEQCAYDNPVGASAADHCVPNLCRPGGDDLGYYQDANYAGRCNADSEGDGICLGPIPGNDGTFGLCFGADGEQALGETCSPAATHGGIGVCTDAICLEQSNTCAEVCTLFDTASCPNGGCYPIWGNNGVCAPIGVSPVPEVGESCTPTPGIIGCPDDSLCVEQNLQEGAATVCMSMCNNEATAGMPGSCAQGLCQAFSDASPIGVCVME